MTRAWAQDFGGRGITVNCVQPGPADTEMNPKDGPFSEVQKGRSALKRYGSAEEVAAAWSGSSQVRRTNSKIGHTEGGEQCRYFRLNGLIIHELPKPLIDRTVA